MNFNSLKADPVFRSSLEEFRARGLMNIQSTPTRQSSGNNLLINLQFFGVFFVDNSDFRSVFKVSALQ